MKKFIILLTMIFHSIIYSQIVYDNGKVKLDLVLQDDGTYITYDLNDDNNPFTGYITFKSDKNFDFDYEDLFFPMYRGGKNYYKDLKNLQSLRGVHEDKYKIAVFNKFMDSSEYYNEIEDDFSYRLPTGKFVIKYVYKDGRLILADMSLDSSNRNIYSFDSANIVYYKNGSVKSIIYYPMGFLFKEEYYLNGNKKSMNFISLGRLTSTDGEENNSIYSEYFNKQYGNKIFYPNGQIKREGKFYEGKLVGEVLYYSPTGKLKEKLDVEKGKKKSYKDSEIFYKDSEKEIILEERGEKIYAVNKKDNTLFTGKLTFTSNEEKDKNEKISKEIEISYKDGVQDGIMKEVTTRTQKDKLTEKLRLISQEKLDEYLRYQPRKYIEAYKENERREEAKYKSIEYISEEKEIKETMYKNGEKNGKYTKTIEINTDFEMSIKKDVEKGTEKERIIEEGYFVNDKKEGEFITTYKRYLEKNDVSSKEDDIKITTSYRNGVKHGKSLTYDFIATNFKEKNNLPKDEPVIIKEEEYVMDRLNGIQSYISKSDEKCQYFYILGIEISEEDYKKMFEK